MPLHLMRCILEGCPALDLNRSIDGSLVSGSGREPLLDSCLGLGQLVRQVVRQLLEQLGVQLQLGSARPPCRCW